ncbi:hypothetical protein VZ232_32475 [Pseudomonas aeruginosa]|uniref:hypothetical protein n=1 Tax=Pseudomonas aeruginosa TaxID=287 RepID=UPI0012987E38|nr:hypothetical protein [Pseudomonas aeruginosa]MED6068001.1 hypothetical protein [Pseudomonas aeruginosa]HCE7963174.1 hypothetical protein [Pseudomonas aeruginosa]HDP3262196.1 hypothetical protein [Pseudomonas aeruginosa]
MMAVRVAVVMVAATVALAGAVMVAATVEPVVVVMVAARPVLAVMVAVRVVATAQGRAVVPVAGRACKVAVRTIAARS